jgi:transcriptional regulator with PAS, ATPase and Fis domain
MKPSPEVRTLRVDDEAIIEIVSDKAVQRVLRQVGAAIHGARSTEILLQRLLETLQEFIPADRAAVLLADLQPAAFRPAPFEVDATLAAKVHGEREATVVQAPSSLLCAPLRAFDSDLGVLYLQSDARNAFSISELRLLAAIACSAATVLEHTQYNARLAGVTKQVRAWTGQDHTLIGNSKPICLVRDFISKVAGYDSTVLITGESGTGKDVVANAIHFGSPRKDQGSIIAINCAAIPESLVESELFGYEKGAFSGADAKKIGQIELAHGGTLFLDEIGDLTLPAQVKLLRVLETRRVQRVGGSESIPVDVRIVGATNLDLEKSIKAGRFREDLYYRLQVAEILMPSLRNIREDIPLLAVHFMKKMGYIRIVSGISDKAMALLTQYHWPGNTRQLRNVIENALLLGGKSSQIEAEDLHHKVTATTPPAPEGAADLAAGMDEYMKSAIERALDETGGNQTETARILKMSTRQLRRLMRKFGLTLD